MAVSRAGDIRIARIAALLAVLVILYWTPEMHRSTDSRAYGHAAQAFARGQDDPTFSQWPPLYPLILATGLSPRLLNAACYGALVYLTLSQVRRWHLALAIAMLTPLRWFPFLYVLSDGLFTTLVAAALIELPRKRIIPLALLLMAAVLVKYAGLFLLIFAALWLIRQGRAKNAAFVVFPALTAFFGWYLRCYALYGKLTITAPIARYTPAENLSGTAVTMIQFLGAIAGCILISVFISRLRLLIRRSFSS